MDIHMPGLHGFALKQKLDARGSPACVIMITARAEGSDAHPIGTMSP
jgi:FixJ family two-component response regulator